MSQEILSGVEASGVVMYRTRSGKGKGKEGDYRVAIVCVVCRKHIIGCIGVIRRSLVT